MSKKYKPLLSKAEKKVKFRKKISLILLVLLSLSVALNYVLIMHIDIPLLDRIINKDSLEEPLVLQTDDASDTEDIVIVLPVGTDLNFSENLELPEELPIDEQLIKKVKEEAQKAAEKAQEFDTGKLEYYVKTKEDIHDAIIEQMDNGATKLVVTYDYNNVMGEVFNEEFLEILDDHPEYFWTNGGGHWDNDNIESINNYNYFKYTLILDLTCEEETIVQKQEELNKAVDSIVKEAQKLNSDYEKAKYVHDYLVESACYDEEGFYNSQHGGTFDNLMYTAYGNLVNRKSVCAGYAKAYNLVMNKLGVECGNVSGVGITSAGNGAHGWNYIKIDDEYYFVDVTWDDPTYPDGYEPEGICYDYFLINYDQISKDHIFNDDQEIPECTSTKYMKGGDSGEEE